MPQPKVTDVRKKNKKSKNCTMKKKKKQFFRLTKIDDSIRSIFCYRLVKGGNRKRPKEIRYLKIHLLLIK